MIGLKPGTQNKMNNYLLAAAIFRNGGWDLSTSKVSNNAVAVVKIGGSLADKWLAVCLGN